MKSVLLTLALAIVSVQSFAPLSLNSRTPTSLNAKTIDLTGKTAFIAGVADSTGYGWAIAKQVSDEGGRGGVFGLRLLWEVSGDCSKICCSQGVKRRTVMLCAVRYTLL